MNSVMHRLLPAVMMISIAMGCGAGAPTSPQETTETGTIFRQEMSSYQYGSHVLMNDAGSISYALTSDVVDLDSYAGTGRMVRGIVKPGYPIDGGPPYLQVLSVR